MNITFNLSNLSPDIKVQDICLSGTKDAYSPECLYKNFCPQFSHYFVNTGLWIIVIYVLSSWILWLWWNVIYINLDIEHIYETYPFLRQMARWKILGIDMEFGIGDLRDIKVKLYWDSFIRNIMAKMLLGYVIVVVYLSMFPVSVAIP